MKSVLTIAALFALSVPTLFASSKSDPREGRYDEAISECVSYLHDHSKDPSTFQADKDSATWQLGHGIFGKYSIWVTVEGRGKNTYGAILEHSFSCEVQCKKDIPCNTVSVEDSPR